ncbi:CLC_0170 family protein [Clostridium sp. UBA7339]|uniref:CLC_0170 family protein n=1 Tax=Clostridium sp. UBA7339 TaxID=1946376 RepID=UPI003217D745
MMRLLIERFDIYLIILILVSGYMMVGSDVRYFSREDKQKAKKQSLVIGIAMMLVVVGMFILRGIVI